jgi:hypothetical protein
MTHAITNTHTHTYTHKRERERESEREREREREREGGRGREGERQNLRQQFSGSPYTFKKYFSKGYVLMWVISIIY